MKPHIDRTMFGSITIEGERFERDVIIRLSGKVKKRKKKLSKAVYGTSHVLSLEEAQHVHQKRAQRLIIGAGQFEHRLGHTQEGQGIGARRRIGNISSNRADVTDLGRTKHRHHL